MPVTPAVLGKEMVDAPVKLSVVIPVYHNPEGLRRAVQALSRQTCAQNVFEVIVVHDDVVHEISDADLTEWRRAIPRFRFFVKDRSGVAGARNYGWKRASGEIVAFLDHDCVPAAHWVKSILEFFERSVEVDGIGGQVLSLSSTSLVSQFAEFTQHLREPTRAKGEIVTIITANSAFRRQALMAIGGFDEGAFNLCAPSGGEDVDLTHRLKQAGFSLAYAPGVIVFHQHRATVGALLRQHYHYGKGMYVFCKVRSIQPGRIGQFAPTFAGFVRFLVKRFSRLLRARLPEWRRRGLPWNLLLIYSILDVSQTAAYAFGMRHAYLQSLAALSAKTASQSR